MASDYIIGTDCLGAQGGAVQKGGTQRIVKHPAVPDRTVQRQASVVPAAVDRGPQKPVASPDPAPVAPPRRVLPTTPPMKAGKAPPTASPDLIARALRSGQAAVAAGKRAMSLKSAAGQAAAKRAIARGQHAIDLARKAQKVKVAGLDEFDDAVDALHAMGLI